MRRFKTIELLARQCLLEQVLNAGELLKLVGTDQRHGAASRAGATGAADTVYIVFGYMRQIKIHHQRQLVYVEPAGGKVGGD